MLSKFQKACFTLFVFFVFHVESLGSVLHYAIVDQALKSYFEINPFVAEFLKKNMNSLVSGSIYPDTEYIPMCPIDGDILHKNKFLEVYGNYTQAKCPIKNFAQLTEMSDKCQELLAHLFGVSSHLVVDEPFHNKFMAETLKISSSLIHNAFEFLLDQYWVITNRSSSLKDLILDSPIPDLNKILREMNTSQSIQFAETKNKQCNTAHDYFVYVWNDQIPTIWKYIGCQLNNKDGIEICMIKLLLTNALKYFFDPHIIGSFPDIVVKTVNAWKEMETAIFEN